MKFIIKRIIRIFGYAWILLLAVIIVYPIIVTVCGSFMSAEDISFYFYENNNPSVLKLIPDHFTLSQYWQAFVGNADYTRALINSFLYTIPTVLLQLLITVLAAYGFSFYDFPAKRTVFALYLLLMLVPYQAIEIPHYFVLRDFNIIGTSAAIILPNIFSTFGICLLTKYFSAVNKEAVEAAQLDGANFLKILWYVVLPEAQSGVAIVFMLQFIDVWNMTEQPLMFLNETSQYPLSVMLQNLNKQFPSYAFAFSVVFMIPVIVVYLCLSDRIEHEVESSLISVN